MLHYAATVCETESLHGTINYEQIYTVFSRTQVSQSTSQHQINLIFAKGVGK
jgi:hypothetical protein